MPSGAAQGKARCLKRKCQRAAATALQAPIALGLLLTLLLQRWVAEIDDEERRDGNS